MDKKSNSVSTSELFVSLSKTSSLDSFFASFDEDFFSTGIRETLSGLLVKYHLTKQAVIKAANLERSVGYQIFNGYRRPRRDNIICIAIGMHLTLDETQNLLRVAQHGDLYPKNRRDAALIFCILHQMDHIQTQMLLDGINESPLS